MWMWKAGKLDWNKFYYIKLTSGEICIDYAHGAYFIKGKPQEITMDYTTNNDVKQILAPVPTYDEYKAIQEELAEHRYYCCCMENEVMRLKLAEMEEKNKIWDELAKPEDFDAIGNFFDEHDFSVADLLAIICARLSEFPEKVFTTEFMVNGHEFGIKIRRK